MLELLIITLVVFTGIITFFTCLSVFLYFTEGADKIEIDIFAFLCVSFHIAFWLWYFKIILI